MRIILETRTKFRLEHKQILCKKHKFDGTIIDRTLFLACFFFFLNQRSYVCLSAKINVDGFKTFISERSHTRHAKKNVWNELSYHLYIVRVSEVAHIKHLQPW